MEDNKDPQIQMKKIPAFTVLKNGSILKNIFLLRKQSAIDQSSQFQEPDEEILFVGRHPHCHITLEHPSISRYHLRIHSYPSSHTLSVVDLSSVHGTWVSGRRIEPGVHVVLKEGDTVKMGGSSRVYELHWVPMSQAYKVDEAFVPTVYTIKEGEEETHQDEKREECSSDDDLEGLDLSLSNEIHDSPLKKLDLLTSSVPGCSSSNTVVEHSGNENDDIVLIQDPLAVSETTSATQVSDGLSISEDQLYLLRDNIIKDDLVSVPDCSKSSCDDTEVEHSSPRKSDGNGEPFTAISIQAPLIVSEAISETGISACLNKQEDQLREDMSDEFDEISHGTLKDDPVSFDLFNAIEAKERDDIIQDIGRSNEIEIDCVNEPENQLNTNNSSVPVVCCEFQQMNQTKMMDESASMVLYDGVDTGVKFESVDHEIMKNESVFVLLPDVADMDQEKTSTPYISKAKEIDMNLQSAQNVPASMKFFDSLDGKELEFYTPDKENKNPNAWSGKSLSKKAVNSTVLGRKDIYVFSQKLFATDEGVTREHELDPFVSCEELVAASLEKENKSRQVIIEGNCNSNCLQNVQNAVNSTQNLPKKRWTMVVDSNSLLDHKSLKHLKLLEGIKGTQLFVPKIVVNELMGIKSQDSFFNRSSKKASSALKWIDECMMNTGWWIHMVDEAVHPSALPPQVLEIAIHLRKEITDQKVIILSNNLTLKIKAMAEGIMCEAAEEFRESLVNPFSERFMWVGSSARGLTWSCVDDDDSIVRQKYHGAGLNRSHRFKGLKLLAHLTTSQLVTT